MRKDLEKLFEKLEQIEPPEKLRDRILAKIELEEKHSAKIWLVFTGTIAVFSFIAIIPAFQYTMREFSQSGFYQYLLLLFLDSGAVLSSWKGFALSLAESLPALEITIFLATIFAFLGSMRLAFKNISGAFLSSKLT